MKTRQEFGRRAFLKMLGSAGAVAAFTRLIESPLGAVAQPPGHVTDSIGAAVDTLFPATPGLKNATGAVEMRVHEFVIQAFDSYLALIPTQRQGVSLSAVVATTLDAHAMQVTPGKTFVQQTYAERLRTFALMDESPDGDVRFIGFALPGMAALGFYTEWPAYGSQAELHHDEIDLGLLPVWREIGFGGPKNGYAKLLHPYNPASPIDPRDPSIP